MTIGDTIQKLINSIDYNNIIVKRGGVASYDYKSDEIDVPDDLKITIAKKFDDFRQAYVLDLIDGYQFTWNEMEYHDCTAYRHKMYTDILNIVFETEIGALISICLFFVGDKLDMQLSKYQILVSCKNDLEKKLSDFM